MGHFAKKKSCLHGPSFRNHCTCAIPFINFVQGLGILLLLNLFFFNFQHAEVDVIGTTLVDYFF